MLVKKIKILIIILLLYQSPLYSKSLSFDEINSKNLSKYFSGIIAFENNQNLKALDYFQGSKALLNKHDPYLKRYIYSLVLENKISQAINLIKLNKDNDNANFFDAHILLVIDSLKKNNFDKAKKDLLSAMNLYQNDRFNLAILETLKHYIYVFKEKKILKEKQNFGKLSIISETFQKCYLGDRSTDSYFSNLFNDPRTDYSRYIFFYLSYLIENNRFSEAKKITDEVDYINSTLLLSQGKEWIDTGNIRKFTKFFSCKNHNDIVSEFFFLISNLYSSQNDLKKSNYYLNLSIFLNPKFIFNLSLIAENQYLNNEYEKVNETLKKFGKDNTFYSWYKIKKQTQIIAKQKNKKESLKYIISEFDKIDKSNNKFLFDLANFHKNSKEYEKAVEYYSKILENLSDDSEVRSDILYRRGGSYERMGKYKKADEDLLLAIKLNPDDAYYLNYLAYSWLERKHKIDESIEMLKIAFDLESNDPYIIDSIGWAYYLINDYKKAEEYLKRAVELMPDDPVVNDHYGDILWKLNRKIQARYFWKNVLGMDNAEAKILKEINIKLIKGL